MCLYVQRDGYKESCAREHMANRPSAPEFVACTVTYEVKGYAGHCGQQKGNQKRPVYYKNLLHCRSSVVYGCKDIASRQCQTITIVKKCGSTTISDARQRYGRDAEIRCDVMLRNALDDIGIAPGAVHRIAVAACS